MLVDKDFCASTYLMYRYVFDETRDFSEATRHENVSLNFARTPVKTAQELISALKKEVEIATADGKAALALSGGMDSAILACFMPKGSTAYTFRCVVPGVKVTDETVGAAHWAKENGLNHKIVEIRWENVESVVGDLMRHKGAPTHSIEAQIFLAAQQAKRDGFGKFIFGENADIIYGGMDGLLKKDWLFGEFVERYSYIMPYKVLRNAQIPLAPFYEFEKDGKIEAHGFINKYFRQESLGSYYNACQTAKIQFVAPYSKTFLDAPLNLEKVRAGESKYLVREAFSILYPGEKIPAKIPMPRPVDQWLANWQGPKRREFLPNCIDGLTGDQKWQLWCLERFFDLNEGKR